MAYGSAEQASSTSSGETTRLPRAAASGFSRGRARSDALTAEWIFYPLFVGLVHLLIVQTAASLALRYGQIRPQGTSPPFPSCLGQPPTLSGWQHTIVEPLRTWDATWYRLIALSGYGHQNAAPPHAPGDCGIFGNAKSAFWPLYPWMMGWMHDVTGMSVDLAGYLIANVSFIIALMLLYRLVALDFNSTLARRTLWCIALFPVSLFFSALYTESLFLCLAVGSLLAARHKRWWLAGAVGALAALTRSYGVLLGLPLLVLFLQDRGWRPRRWLPDGISLGLPALGPLIFGLVLRRDWNDFFAFVHVQEQWYRFSATPWRTMQCALHGCSVTTPYLKSVHQAPFPAPGASWDWLRQLIHHPTWAQLTNTAWRDLAANSNTLELVSTLLFLILAAFGLRYLPFYQSAFLIPGLVIPLFSPSAVHPLMSMPRFGLTLFPLFILLAMLFNRRAISIPIAIVSTILLIGFTVQFAQWYWVS